MRWSSADGLWIRSRNTDIGLSGGGELVGMSTHARAASSTRAASSPNYAIFYVTVEDVPATLARAEAWAPSA
jgi:hypothetical protein